jgi:O-antigen/teichoic acid export membrane protein
MISDLKQLTKSSGIYAAGQILAKAVGFFMIPLYTRHLEPRDYGIMELLDTVMFFATIFAGIGVNTAVMRFYALSDEEKDKGEVVGTAIVFFGLSSALLGGLILLTGPWVAQAVLGDRSMASFVQITAVTLVFSNLCEVPLTYWRARERAGWYVGISLARMVVSMTALIISLAVLKLGLVGALYANLVTSFLFAGVILGLAFREVPFCLVADKLKPMLRFGAPLIITGLSSFIVVFSDRYFLRHFASLADVGVYALGYKLSSVVVVLVTVPFTLAWQGQQFELARKENALELYSKIQTYQWFVGIFFALAVSVMARDVLPWIAPPAYAAATSVVPLIAFSYVLANTRTVIQSGMYVRGATQYAALIAAVVTAVNLGLNYLLIPQYLVIGAAWATVISYAVSLVLTFVVVQRMYHVHYEYGRNAVALGAAAAVYLLSRWLVLPPLASFVADALLACGFLLVLLLLLDRDERGMFWKLGLSVTDTLRRAAVWAK